MALKDYSDSDDAQADGQRVFNEFDCPDCNANNPYDDGFVDGDEIRCYYCGAEYKVRVVDGKLRLKMI
ncbi:MAG: hypothetical protein JXR96_29735 [Deltaproteobacteria bacterium]|nr:hypothetical protein [Deltaproteobacteria bacterium]